MAQALAQMGKGVWGEARQGWERTHALAYHVGRRVLLQVMVTQIEKVGQCCKATRRAKLASWLHCAHAGRDSSQGQPSRGCRGSPPINTRTCAPPLLLTLEDEPVRLVAQVGDELVE